MSRRVAPDFLCIGKGSGGYLPLATLTTERVHDGFLGAHEEFRTFFHGHTFTGNPLACAAAIASLDAFERERTLIRVQPKIRLLGDLLGPVAAMPEVAEVRGRELWSGSTSATTIRRSGSGTGGRRGAPGGRSSAARRRRGADASARDLEGRPSTAGRDHGRVDRRRGIGVRPRGEAAPVEALAA